MTWTWGDPIDDTTDLSDVNLWQSLLSAVHERGKTTYIQSGWFYYNLHDTVSVTPGYPDKYQSPVTIRDDLLKTTTSNTSEYWWHKSIYEMQAMLKAFVDVGYFWNFEDYPAGLDGLELAPADSQYTVATAAAKLGYPADLLDSSGDTPHARVFRRRRPRTITSLTAQYAHTKYASGFANLLTPVEYEIGSRAQYFGVSGALYQGIYEYTATATWTPCTERDAAADVLDSNEPFLANNWIAPGLFQAGDYFGPWLLDDIYQLVKRMRWVYTPYSDTREQRAGGDIAFVFDEEFEVEHPWFPSLAAAKSAAEAELADNIATDTEESPHISNDLEVGAAIYPYSSGYNKATLFTVKLSGSVITYRNLAREIDWYIYPIAPYGESPPYYSGDNTTHFGLTLLEHKKIATTTAAAASHDWDEETHHLWTPVPTFGGMTPPGDFYDGFKLGGFRCLIKWDYTYV